MKTTDVDLAKYDCKLMTASVVDLLNGNKPSKVEVWATPMGQQELATDPEFIFTRADSFVMCRHEDAYGIPNSIKSGVGVILGNKSFKRAPILDPFGPSSNNVKPVPLKPRSEPYSASLKLLEEETMGTRGQTAIFNVRGKMLADAKCIYPIMASINSVIIHNLLPEDQDIFLPDYDLGIIKRVCEGFRIPDKDLHKTIDSIVSCYRMVKFIIPTRFLGSVMYSHEQQTLQFNSQGIFDDEDNEFVIYSDDSPSELLEVTINALHDPETVAMRRAQNEMLLTTLNGAGVFTTG